MDEISTLRRPVDLPPDWQPDLARVAAAIEYIAFHPYRSENERRRLLSILYGVEVPTDPRTDGG